MSELDTTFDDEKTDKKDKFDERFEDEDQDINEG